MLKAVIIFYIKLQCRRDHKAQKLSSHNSSAEEYLMWEIFTSEANIFLSSQEFAFMLITRSLPTKSSNCTEITHIPKQCNWTDFRTLYKSIFLMVCFILNDKIMQDICKFLECCQAHLKMQQQSNEIYISFIEQTCLILTSSDNNRKGSKTI